MDTYSTTRLERLVNAKSGMLEILLRAKVSACRVGRLLRGCTGTSVKLLSSSHRCRNWASPSKLSSGTEVIWLASKRLTENKNRHVQEQILAEGAKSHSTLFSEWKGVIKVTRAMAFLVSSLKSLIKSNNSSNTIGWKSVLSLPTEQSFKNLWVKVKIYNKTMLKKKRKKTFKKAKIGRILCFKIYLNHKEKKKRRK